MCIFNKKIAAFFITLVLGLTAAVVFKRNSAQWNADYYEIHSQPYISAREFTPTEQKLMAVIRKLEIWQTEKLIANRNFNSKTDKLLRDRYSSRELTEFLELQVDSLNAGCTKDDLSDSACEARRLSAIRDIEENMLFR